MKNKIQITLIVLLLVAAAVGLFVLRDLRTRLTAAEVELHALRAERVEMSTARTIKRVIDGDTIVLDGDEHVRILGIDTPELSRHTKRGGWARIKNPDPRGLAARDWLRSFEGRRVRLTYDKQKRDMYKRTLANVYILPDGPDVATYLLQQRWAKVMAIPPNLTRYREWKIAAGK